VDAVNLLLLFIFYFSVRALASTLVDTNDLLSVLTFNVDADNRSLASTLSGHY
jgi:hypothetical protein